jgi:hypothetical protein
MLNYRIYYQKYAQLKHFQTKNLIMISQFMGHEPVTGFTTVNRTLNILPNLIRKVTGFRMPLANLSYENNRLFNAISHYVVCRDLQLLLTRLRNEDQLISQDLDRLKELPDELLNKICFERGINIG